MEVLSNSTGKADTAIKLLLYINLPSSQEYVLIEQDFVCRQGYAGVSIGNRIFYVGDAIVYTAIGLTLIIADDYYDCVDHAELIEFR